MLGPRRCFAVVNVRLAFSVDVHEGSEAATDSDADLAELLVSLLREHIGELKDDPDFIEPTLDVKALVTSRPIPA